MDGKKNEKTSKVNLVKIKSFFWFFMIVNDQSLYPYPDTLFGG